MDTAAVEIVLSLSSDAELLKLCSYVLLDCISRVG